jgi:hypothetical protein
MTNFSSLVIPPPRTELAFAAVEDMGVRPLVCVEGRPAPEDLRMKTAPLAS